MKTPVMVSLTILSTLLLETGVAAAQDMPPTLVTTSDVRSREFNDQITLVGRTEAWVESRIVSEVSGRVKSVDAVEGTWLKAGSPLVRIDGDKTKFLLDSKTAQADQARLEAGLASSNLERARELYAQNLVRKTTLDSAEVWVGIANARSEQLTAEVNSLKLDLENSVISAPFSGYSGRKLIDVGEWVQPGMPVYEMVDLSRVRVNVDLPERYFGHLTVGSSVNIRISGLDSLGVEGTVTGLAPNASAETHTFPVIVEVPNTDGILGGGMLVRATLSLDEKFTSLAVSKDAIVRQPTGTIVYTVVEGKAQPVPVSTSSTDGEWIAVSAQGLSEGMPVVVRGNERIFPGSPVRVADGGSPEVGAVSDNSGARTN